MDSPLSILFFYELGANTNKISSKYSLLASVQILNLAALVDTVSLNNIRRQKLHLPIASTVVNTNK
jgi:hypothetical protein